MKLTQWMAAGALSLAAGVANAAVITDTMTINQTISDEQQHSWTHNINDDGYTRGTGITSAQLTINFTNMTDYDAPHAQIRANNNSEIISLNWFSNNWTRVNTGDWGRQLGLSAVARLSNEGLLEVIVESWRGASNIFTINSSTLTVNTDEVASVPEPASLAILGLGLAGLGVARRHAKKA